MSNYHFTEHAERDMLSLTSSLYLLLEVVLLVLNGVAILNKNRFLVPMGITKNEYGGPDSVQNKLANIVFSLQTVGMYPLIGANIFWVVVTFFLG